MRNFLKQRSLNDCLGYRLLAGGLLMCLFLLGSYHVAWTQSPAGDQFYYNGEQQIILQPSTRFVAVHLQDGVRFQPSAAVSMKLAAGELMELQRNKLNLYKLQSDVSAGKAKVDAMQIEGVRAELSTAPGVSFLAPVFQTQDALMIVTDEFFAQFSSDTTRDEIDGLNGGNGVEIVRQLNWSPDTYLLRVMEGDCLETANAYHEMSNVIFAHPNFVRVADSLRPDGSTLTRDLSFDRVSQVIPPLLVAKPGADDEPQTTSFIAAPMPAAPVPLAAVARTTLLTTDFEVHGSQQWSDYTPWVTSGTPRWEDAWKSIHPATRVYNGDSAAYCVDAGVGFVNPPGPYPNNVDSRMVYGSFDLSDAAAARLSFRTWVNTEYDADYFIVFVSTDGMNYSGTSMSGNWAAATGGSGYMHWAYDLGDYLGDSSVWVMFNFISDGGITREGVYLDDIVIEKHTGGYESLTSDVYDHLQWSLENNGQLWSGEGADIDATDAWTLAQGQGAVIAIIDEGVDLTHPDLNLVGGYDATLSGSAGGPSGDDAHGTGCAGIAAAVTDNGKGVAGVAGKARVMPIRIAYGDGSGNWVSTDAWIADGLTWAVDNGADVLSNSWGGGSPTVVIDSALAYARTNGRDGKGCFVVFATGNDNGAVSYPATSSDVMAVGALSPCDERTSPDSCDGEFWWGSNYGPQVDIAAPGVHMYTTDIQGAAGYAAGDYYNDFNGTSSATPVVAGVGGLLLGMCPGLAVGDVEDILTRTTDDLETAGWDQYTGYGRVNAYQALKYAQENNCPEGSSWSMYLAAITANNRASSALPQWGALSEVCCETSSVTFTLSTSGVGKSSTVADCSTVPSWQGWEVTAPGSKTFSWSLTSAKCGSYSGSFNYSLLVGKSYLFQVELDDSNNLVVMVYINTLSSSVQKESLADGSKSAAADEVKAGRKLVATIPLEIPKGAFGKSSCKITE